MGIDFAHPYNSAPLTDRKLCKTPLLIHKSKNTTNFGNSFHFRAAIAVIFKHKKIIIKKKFVISWDKAVCRNIVWRGSKNTAGMNPKLGGCERWWETKSDSYYYYFSPLGCSSHYFSQDPVTGTSPQLPLLMFRNEMPWRKWGNMHRDH